MPSVNRSVGQTRLIKFQQFIVNPNSTHDEIILPIAVFKSQKMFIEVTNIATGNVIVFTCTVAANLVTGPDDTIFGKVGDELDYTFNVVSNSTDVVIRMTNNESDSLAVSVIRITF